MTSTIAAEFGAKIHDQPWARETKLTDPDGNRLRVATGHKNAEESRM